MRFSIQLPKMDAAEFTPSGALLFDAYATGVGVYEYALEDGRIVYEYKSLDEVGKTSSLSTIAGVHLTHHHPPQFITLENWKAFSIGMFLNPGAMDGRRVKTRGIAYDRKVIDAMLAGELTEISMGYWQESAARSGDFEGQAYTIEQTNILYNHGALYEPGGGRLGPSIGVKLDGKDWRQHAPLTTQNTDSRKEKTVMIFDFGGVAVDIPDDQTAAIQAAKTAASNFKQLKDSNDKLQGRLTTLESAQNQDSKAKQDEAYRKQVEDAAADRFNLCQAAAAFLRDDYDFKGKSNLQIMRDSLDSVGIKLPETASEVQARSSFDTAVELMKQDSGRGGPSPVKTMLNNLGSGIRGDGAQGSGSGADYVPLHKRVDGRVGDASAELAAMNRYYNNPQNFVAGGRSK